MKRTLVRPKIDVDLNANGIEKIYVKGAYGTTVGWI